MDAETARILVATSGTLIAGVLGAVTAGVWNQRNARITLDAAQAAAREERDSQRERERLQWVRDQKKDAYETFLEASENLLEAYYTAGADVRSRAPLRVARGRLRIVGSGEVRQAATTVILAAAKLFELGEDALQDNQFEVSVRLDELADATDGFVRAARNDLALSASDDGKLGKVLERIPLAMQTRTFRRTYLSLGGGSEEEEEEEEEEE